MEAKARYKALRLLRKMSRPHRRAFLRGSLATVAVVLLRIALPWPLRGVMEQAFPGTAGQAGQMLPVQLLPWTPILILCISYFLISLGVGFFERGQRVAMARVASRTAHDIREAAVAGARSTNWDDPARRADFITRIIGDTARIKADLKGILIHLLTNGLLLAGITVMFLFLAPKLGLLFLLSGLLAVFIGYRTVEVVARITRKQRRKESRYAGLLEMAWQDLDTDASRTLSQSSAKKDVRTTWLIGRSTIHVYAVVAALISLALWIGIQDVRAGNLAPGVLFLFIAYSITIQRRAARVGRQIARGGKLLANTDRMRRLIRAAPEKPQPQPILAATFRLHDITVRADTPRRRRNRLGPVNLQFPQGARVLVLGGEGAGKSSLLQVLAGDLDASTGRYLWGERDVAAESLNVRNAVGFMPEEPLIRGTSARALLGLDNGRAPNAAAQETLETLGAWRAVRRLAEGLDQAIDSRRLSWSEKKSLSMARVVLSPRLVWILDTPVTSSRGRDRKRLAHILDRAADRTLVISLRSPLLAERFSHVVMLKKGRVEFFGSPKEWRETHG